MNNFDPLARPPRPYYSDKLTKQETPPIDVFDVTKNDVRNVYRVIRIYHCDCLGFHHTQNCRHIKRIRRIYK